VRYFLTISKNISTEAIYSLDSVLLYIIFYLNYSLQYLENLQYLNIQDNNITTIPEAVCSLKKLHTIKQGWTHVFDLRHKKGQTCLL